MDSPDPRSLGLTVAELMLMNSRKTAAHDYVPDILKQILDTVKDHSLTKGRPTFAKFVIGGYYSDGSMYDIRSTYLRFCDDIIEARNIIARIREILEDPKSYGFTTSLEGAETYESLEKPYKLVIDWSNPK
jgi:hypothetical protein